MADNTTPNDTPEEQSPFVSKLAEGRQRFLAHTIEHSFECGRRSPEDFIRHFPPSAIMEGLKDRPQLRARILAHTTGIKTKIALKKSWNSAADDLQIALDERETDAEAIVSVFDPDDRVRYLDATRVWNFLIEGEFWNTGPSNKEGYRIAKRHMAFMLDRALTDKLTTHRDVVEGITVSEMAARLPKSELGKIIEGALTSGQQNAPFTEVELLSAMPPEVLVDYVPLAHIYSTVIKPRVAEKHGYSQQEPKAQAEAAAGAEKPEQTDQVDTEASPEDKGPALRTSVPPPSKQPPTTEKPAARAGEPATKPGQMPSKPPEAGLEAEKLAGKASEPPTAEKGSTEKTAAGGAAKERGAAGKTGEQGGEWVDLADELQEELLSEDDFEEEELQPV